MRLIPFYLLLVIALAACGTEEPPPPGPDTTEAERQAEPDVSEPEVATPDDDETTEAVRERRERLREEMREHRRTAAEDDRVARSRPSTATETETDWWHDEALAADLELDEQQRIDIEEAATTHRQMHREGRRQMVELRRQLSRDLAEEDEQGQTEAREQREQLRHRLEAADRDWQAALEDILEPSQLERLEAIRPDALRPDVRRVIERDAEAIVEDEPPPPSVD